MPLYKLTRIAPPSAFVAGALSALHANSPAVEKTRLASRDERHVARAYVDTTTGEAQIFPDLSIAGRIFSRADVIPHDATEYRVGQPTPVYAATVARTADGRTKPVSATELLFTYVPA